VASGKKILKSLAHREEGEIDGYRVADPQLRGLKDIVCEISDGRCVRERQKGYQVTIK